MSVTNIITLIKKTFSAVLCIVFLHWSNFFSFSGEGFNLFIYNRFIYVIHPYDNPIFCTTTHFSLPPPYKKNVLFPRKMAFPSRVNAVTWRSIINQLVCGARGVTTVARWLLHAGFLHYYLQLLLTTATIEVHHHRPKWWHTFDPAHSLNCVLFVVIIHVSRA